MDVYDGYIRVSSVGGREGERFQSPGQQRDAIERWATYKGVQIAHWEEDLDRSGGTLNRPGFQRILERIKNEETKAIVISKSRPFSRSVVHGLSIIESITSTTTLK